MLADIIEYCQERGTYIMTFEICFFVIITIGLKTEGGKSQLIEDLISWVKFTFHSANH